MSKFPKPLFQSDGLSVKPSVHLHRKDVDFHCALIFKVRVFGTQKWAINFFTLHCTGVWF